MSSNTLADLLVKELTPICRSCAEFSFCELRKKSIKIVIQCEQYHVAGHSKHIDMNNTKPVETPSEEMKGLCSNCGKASYCTLQKNSAGIWHCEEYE